MSEKLFYTILIIFFLLIASSCDNPKEAREVLVKTGYHPIKVGGYDWNGCSKDDWYATKFKAYNADSSQILTGTVCQGIFKGKTIRYD